MVCMVGIVLVRQRTMAVHIAILDQIKIDGSGGICIHNLFVAVCVRKNLANKQGSIHLSGAVCNCFGQFALQAFGETVIAFAGNDSQDVDVMHIVAQNIRIHAFAVLVDAQTQAAANLLPFADFTAALFQGADLEHVRVIPSFPEGRV